MDIEYLLFLQNFRESTNDLFSPFLIWITKFAVGFWPIAMVCMVYWVFDRKAGKRLLAGFVLGVLTGGFLKDTFRIERPWLRDERVIPYGDSKASAKGYSFPSSHATYATSLFGGLAWWQKKRNKVVTGILLAAMILTLFSRNYLGVHTPQDVIVGMIATIIMMCLANFLENWTDEDPNRDLIVMAAGIVVCSILFFCFHLVEGIGGVLAFAVCRFFERRYFDFDEKLKIKDRFIVGVIALIPLYWWYNSIVQICVPYSRALGRFALHSGIMVYTLIVVPLIMKKIRLPEWMG